MNTYWHIFNVGLQSALTYRVNFFSRALFNLVPLVAAIALWKAIYPDNTTEIAGYTLAQMLLYYLLVTILEAATAVTEDEWQIAAEIKDGQLGQFLVRPLNYLHYRLSLFCAGRVAYTLAALVPVGLFILWHRQYLMPPPDLVCGLLFLVSVVLAGLLQFLLSYVTALLAFWVLEISSFSFILLAFERLVSGQMFPLDILPRPLAAAVMWTPFPYCTFFPVSLYLGRVNGSALATGLLLQLMWVVAIYALAGCVWRRGLKTYTLVGG
jgi:viologen exporter family transport system permease protein